ncbi:unnamed protein product [Phytophthora fragariaefolia]|uniref:Unnamed protein product n=1 Tax=Phytophthora fragariaefolia TaxID=1490495 RepID=A0A9W6XXR4_9STRA|nr:unnamed protein product [Phytophthora fragariaefolia]
MRNRRVDELLREMQDAAAKRDKNRAAVYVATVRPAMTSQRYVRTDREERPTERAECHGHNDETVTLSEVNGTAGHEGANERDDVTGARIAEARMAKRQNRRQAKRERVRRARTKPRQEQQEVAQEQQRVHEARQAERRQQIEAAMQQLEEKRKQRSKVREVRDGAVVCVSLVQRERRRSTVMDEPNESLTE